MMRRSAVLACIVAPLVLAGACATAPAQPGSAGIATPTGSTPSPSASAPSASAAPYQPAHVAPFDLTRIRTIPRDYVFGVAYPYDLLSHCGVDLAGIIGTGWRAEEPWRGPLPGWIAGTMELLDADRARFVIDLQYFDTPVDVIMYRRTNEPVGGCD